MGVGWGGDCGVVLTWHWCDAALQVIDTSESVEEMASYSRYKYPNMKKKQGEFTLSVTEGDFTDSQIIVMLGENGTGKTTFIRMLVRRWCGCVGVYGCVHGYIHTCLHKYIHANRQTDKHTYIQTYIQTYMLLQISYYITVHTSLRNP